MVKQDEINEGKDLPNALPDEMIAKILLYPVLSVLILGLFNSQNLLTRGFYERWGSRFQFWINFDCDSYFHYHLFYWFNGKVKKFCINCQIIYI